jgi:hypothetical protein
MLGGSRNRITNNVFIIRGLTQRPFDEALRRVYSEPLREPVPQDMLDLLARLK